MPATPKTPKPVTTLDVSAISPTQFTRSPRTQSVASSPKTPQINTRLLAIVKRIIENYTTWQVAQEKGTRFCTQLENIKLKLLDKAKSIDNADAKSTPSVYSNDLTTWHDKLQVVIEVFEDIVKNVDESLKQLRALEQLQAKGDKESVIFMTWPMRRFIEVAEKILGQFEQELLVKRKVFQEICHRCSSSEVILVSSSWSYPRYVTNETRFLIKCLTTECGLPGIESTDNKV